METNIDNLSKEVYEITQNCGTEPPFSGKLLNEKRKGTYLCIVCKEELFNSNTKFESGSGWPSFKKPVNDNVLDFIEDFSFSMVRTEVKCKCGSHLGHVFEDGPKDKTGLRYCVNSISLDFEEEKN